MENTGGVHSIKGCVVIVMCFGFKHDGTLCYYIVSGGRISMDKSNSDIILI